MINFVLASRPLELTDGHLDLSFTDLDPWFPVHAGGQLAVEIGDPTSGPVIVFTAFPELDRELPFPAHMHLSDTFRLTVRGSQFVGAQRYEAGEFRMHQASKAYGGDGANAHGDGHWTFVMFGDRRGGRMIPTNRKDPWWTKAGRELPPAHLDTDPEGVTGLETNFGVAKRNGRLDGSFTDRASWQELDAWRHGAVVLLGDPTTGPANVCLAVEPDAVALAGGTVDTEVLFVVVDGSCIIDGRRYGQGEMRLQDAAHPIGDITAEPAGLSLLAICGDRSGLDGSGDLSRIYDRLRADVMV